MTTRDENPEERLRIEEYAVRLVEAAIRSRYATLHSPLDLRQCIEVAKLIVKGCK